MSPGIAVTKLASEVGGRSAKRNRALCVGWGSSAQKGFPGGSASEESMCTAAQETPVRSLGREDPLEKEMESYSSILAWRIPWTEEPGRLQSMGSQKVGHN